MMNERGMPDQYGSAGAGIAGALIETAGALYDSHQNRKQSKWNVQQTIAAQKREAELAYQRSIEMWNMQNLYNSPQAQMQRFIDAGLNPHLIYGQGSSGNASSAPQYNPPTPDYSGIVPGRYGHAFASILPTLMAVGSWMQQMRKSEVDIQRGGTETERAQQMIDYLARAQPKMLEGLENKLSLFPYQKDMQIMNMHKAYQTVADLQQEFRFKYGDDLFRELRTHPSMPGQADVGGMKRLQFMEQVSKSKLAEARASWSEFDITDPQAIMMLVLNGVMGLAGQTMRLSARPSSRSTYDKVRTVPRRTGELPPSIRRLHPSRRVN